MSVLIANQVCDDKVLVDNTIRRNLNSAEVGCFPFNVTDLILDDAPG